ncbi:MAG TPA: hypothetical protein VD886_09840 [Herpetosiphonaceae bacterium]|nr:hypothetical protein [Herpetosiphonaceae bacterium]
MLPPGIIESAQLINDLDQSLLAGFANLNHAHEEALGRLGRIYGDTPFGRRLAASLDELVNGVFQPAAFVALAAGRAALQGAQYDRLAAHIRQELGRPAAPDQAGAPAMLQNPPPLLASARHWLMDLAVAGFGRLDPAMIGAFASTLGQLQADPAFLRTAAALAGWMPELLLQPEPVPLFRWCDVWSRAMLTTLSVSAAPAVRSVDGTLYPLGLDWRQHAAMVSLVAYGVLEAGGSAELVTITRSAYKVAAIQQDQLWLLFPEIAPLLESLGAAKALRLRAMPLAPGGHLLWDERAAEIVGAFKPMDLAESYFAPGAARPINRSATPAEQRHPVHLAEPIALAGYRLAQDGDGWTVRAGEHAFALDLRHAAGTEITAEAVGAAERLFGLLRFDAGAWHLRPLYLSPKKGKAVFIGAESGKILAKAPKGHAVGILKERASRLLREKA